MKMNVSIAGRRHKLTASLLPLLGVRCVLFMMQVVILMIGSNGHPQLQSCSFNHFCSCVPLPNSLAEIHCFAAPLTSIPSVPSGHYYRVTIAGSSEIHEITSDLFVNVTVSSFSLTGSKLSELDESVFIGTESTLTTLDLSDNHLRTFPTSALASLPLLQWLSLRGNEIEDLRSRDIAPLSTGQFGLRTLLLSDNRLPIITDACFTRLQQLESLDLAGNMITRIEGKPFPFSLTSLSLSQNLLEYIPVNAFTNLGNLTWLQLRGNLIKSLPSHWFLPTTSLDILDLSHNLLVHFTGSFFTIRPEEVDKHSQYHQQQQQQHQQYNTLSDETINRVTIGDLHLDFNLLEDLTGDSFHHVAIRRLSLSNNKLSTLNTSLFNGPLEYSLQAIDLSFNLFNQISTPINNLKRITSLYMKGNQITNISDDAFIGCKDHLQSLDLSVNSLQRIPTDSLRITSRLLRLNLQDNIINRVSENDITSWANGLLSLSLAKNNLQSIASNAFRHTKNLKELRLSFNKIDHTSTQALIPLRNTLVLLELTSALAPSTATLVMKDISLLSRIEWLDLDLNSLKSFSIDQLASSLPNLLHVDLEANRINHLPAGLFSGTRVQETDSETSSKVTKDKIPAVTTTTTAGDEEEEEEEVITKTTSRIVRANTVTSKLRNVLLSDNELTTLPRGLFDSLDNLMNIALTGNKLTVIEAHTFVNLPSVQNIFLNRNKITKISSNAFTGTNGLSYLYLQENQLTHLPMDFVVMDSRVSLDTRILSESESDLASDASDVITFSSQVTRNGSNSNAMTGEEEQHQQQQQHLVTTSSSALYINVSHNRLTTLGWSQSEVHSFDSSLSSPAAIHAASASQTLSSSSSPPSFVSSSTSTSHLSSKRKLSVRILDASHNNISQLSLLDAFCDRLDSLFLAHNQLTVLPIDSLAKCDRLTTLSLNNNHISRLLMKQMGGHGSDHHMKSKKEEEERKNKRSAQFILPSLQILDLSYNEIHDVSSFTSLVSTLSNLRHLHLSYNRLSHLLDTFFSSLPSSLQVLSLAGNKLVTLPSIGKPLVHLTTLDLSFNQLSQVPTLLDEFNSLVTLKITGNKISNISKDLLRPYRSLKELYLDHNTFVSQFDGSTFSPLVNLQILDMSNCLLQSLNDLPLPKLLQLRVSINKLSNISSFALSKTRRLKNLDISHNLLVDVPRNIWRFVPSLIHLNISYNPIEVLDTTSFNSLSKLRNLDMTGLSLKYVDSRLLYPLRYLISIKTSTYPAVRSFRLHDLLAKSTSLRSVSITVQESILSHQIQWAFGSKLQELVITGSNLVTILPDAFLGLYRTSGLVLRITGTNITQLPPGLLRYLSNRLTLIDLRCNQLQMLKREVLEFQATPSTRSVNDGSRLHFSNGLLLGDNPWICSCNLLWLSEWLRRWAKETRKAYAFNVDMDPSHWSSLFDVTCTTADQDAQRARLIEFQRDIRISCPTMYSSSPSSTYVFSSSFSASSSLSPSFLLVCLWTNAFVTWPATSVTRTLWPLLSLILATFVTYVSSTIFSLECQV